MLAEVGAAVGSAVTEQAAVTGALVALAIGLSEVIKKLADSIFRRVGGDRKEREVSDLRDSMVMMTSNLARTAEAQERMAERMERLDRRIEEREKTDAVVFTRLADAMARIEDTTESNHEHTLQMTVDHRNQINKLEHIEAQLRDT